MQFLDPLIRFRHTLPEGSDVNDLIRENIKDGVGNLVVSPVRPVPPPFAVRVQSGMRGEQEGLANVRLSKLLGALERRSGFTVG